MITLTVESGLAAAESLTVIKLIATRFPGDHELTIRLGARALNLGPLWLYDASEPCLAALREFGDVTHDEDFEC